MEQVLDFLKAYYVYINLALIALVLLLIFIIIGNMISMSKLKKKYRKLTRGTNNKNLEELFVNSMDRIDEMEENTEKALQTCEEASKKVQNCVQKIAVKRFRAFDDVGSDLSFSIALLDGNDDGVVITSIYSRNESVTYAKPIDNGISRYELSDEEKSVVHQASNTIVDSESKQK